MPNKNTYVLPDGTVMFYNKLTFIKPVEEESKTEFSKGEILIKKEYKRYYFIICAGIGKHVCKSKWIDISDATYELLAAERQIKQTRAAVIQCYKPV